MLVTPNGDVGHSRGRRIEVSKRGTKAEVRSRDVWDNAPPRIGRIKAGGLRRRDSVIEEG